MKLDRRFIISILAILALTFLGFTKDLDVAMAIACVACGIAAANSFEKRGKQND
jgi:hypothetical protein